MNYWRINTDSQARDDIETREIWYHYNMVFTGDFDGKKFQHATVLKKMEQGDGVFMHQSGKGIVGFGYVREPWNGIVYQGAQRLLYRKEIYEYRISVKWEAQYDRRKNPLPIQGRLPYMGTYSFVDFNKWNIEHVLQDLKNKY